MARNRMIKPEFWSSETLMRVSRDARLTFIALWNFCDDYGFCLNSTRSLIGDLYPLDEDVTEVKIKKWINELIAVSLLIPIEYKNKRLLFVKGWGEHQTVQHKSKRSFVDVDDLEHIITTSLKSHEDLISIYLDSHAPKRKKKEKEKEKEESNKEKVIKIKYLDKVLLTSHEYENLLKPWGVDQKVYTEHERSLAIEVLDNYIKSSGKTYRCHYSVLQGWVYEKVKIKGRHQSTAKGVKEYNGMTTTNGRITEVEYPDTEPFTEKVDFDPWEEQPQLKGMS